MKLPFIFKLEDITCNEEFLINDVSLDRGYYFDDDTLNLGFSFYNDNEELKGTIKYKNLPYIGFVGPDLTMIFLMYYMGHKYCWPIDNKICNKNIKKYEIQESYEVNKDNIIELITKLYKKNIVIEKIDKKIIVSTIKIKFNEKIKTFLKTSSSYYFQGIIDITFLWILKENNILINTSLNKTMMDKKKEHLKGMHPNITTKMTLVHPNEDSFEPYYKIFPIKNDAYYKIYPENR